MRNAVRSVIVAVAAAAVAIACGSSSDSEFVPDVQNGDDGGGGIPPGTFITPDGGGGPDSAVCKPLTCVTANANCGPIGDGCGGSVASCGTCGVGDTCGGGGKPSQCGRPACKKETCATLGFTCGLAGDGCGTQIDCGKCAAGESCGLGGASKCGAGSDGAACVPTKVACAATDCGPIADGCGALLACPVACPVGQSCGGGGTPSVCGAPPCVKKTCGTQNCGFIADGCGGSVNCWPGTPVCGPGMSCGGGGVANTCGTPAGCTGLCQQQQTCAGGGTTSIEGYVTSPNGVLPVPNAVVYVPNGVVSAFTTGVQCENCASASGNPLVSTTTDANGHFLLPNMPVSTAGKVVDIPVVVQLGRWRKQLTIQTMACANNLVPAVDSAKPPLLIPAGARPTPDHTSAALPRTQSEGDIPLTAISTGSVDGLECVFRKMGVADGEFTNGKGTGRIRLYTDNGACPSGCGSSCQNAGTAACPGASTLYTPCGTCTNGTKKGFACTANADCPGSTCSSIGCANEIDKFDAAIFGCVGGQNNKPVAGRSNVLNYANKGGRVFATHFSYVWLYNQTNTNGGPNYSSPWGATSLVNQWTSNNDFTAYNSATAFIDTSFPKGVLFDNWLKAPVGPAVTYAPPYPNVAALSSMAPDMITIDEPRKDVNPTAPNVATSGILAPAQRWIYTTAAGSTVSPGVAQDAPMHFTFNTDVTKPAAMQCGRVLYSDFHVSTGTTGGMVFPDECSATFSAQEKVLAYMLFDLASCVSPSGPPVCAPKTCAAQSLGCGLAGDGCGNQIDCGLCPAGQTCGGGGVPSQCGAPACAPTTCLAAGANCGKIGDGCGGPLDCGPCTKPGEVCGGGGANVCGGAACVPGACPAPAMGSTCGPVANGCGAVNNCPCPAGLPCVNGQCGAPPCVPRSCAAAGANCGAVADGCGGTLACGNCIAPQTCGGGGTANLCGGGVN